jgi:hypothetical protein
VQRNLGRQQPATIVGAYGSEAAVMQGAPALVRTLHAPRTEMRAGAATSHSSARWAPRAALLFAGAVSIALWFGIGLAIRLVLH